MQTPLNQYNAYWRSEETHIIRFKFYIGTKDEKKKNNTTFLIWQYLPEHIPNIRILHRLLGTLTLKLKKKIAEFLFQWILPFPRKFKGTPFRWLRYYLFHPASHFEILWKRCRVESETKMQIKQYILHIYRRR